MLNQTFRIADRTIGAGAPPFVIAEIGSNFNQDLDTARRLIDAAADAGAHAVKFQLFRADLLYPPGEMHTLFKSIELNADWLPALNEHATQRGVPLMASAFDLGSVDVLERIGSPAHKIASSEATNLGFVHYVASKGKPVILSTGMCDMVDVEEAVAVCLAAGNRDIVLLQCGAVYPLPAVQAHLNVLPMFATRFGGPVGFSDHTTTATVAIASVGLGARVFEKHFTLDRTAKGPDHFYAMEPQELKTYVEVLNDAHAALGSPLKSMLPEERAIGRREGLFAARDLPPGHVLTAGDISVRRPAVGLRARYAPAVVGARLTLALQKDAPISWDSIAFGKGD